MSWLAVLLNADGKCQPTSITTEHIQYGIATGQYHIALSRPGLYGISTCKVLPLGAHLANSIPLQPLAASTRTQAHSSHPTQADKPINRPHRTTVKKIRHRMAQQTPACERHTPCPTGLFGQIKLGIGHCQQFSCLATLPLPLTCGQPMLMVTTGATALNPCRNGPQPDDIISFCAKPQASSKAVSGSRHTNSSPP